MNLIIGIVFWFNVAGQDFGPLHSIRKASEAIEAHDYELLKRFVDVKRVCSYAVEDMVQTTLVDAKVTPKEKKMLKASLEKAKKKYIDKLTTDVQDDIRNQRNATRLLEIELNYKNMSIVPIYPSDNEAIVTLVSDDQKRASNLFLSRKDSASEWVIYRIKHFQ